MFLFFLNKWYQVNFSETVKLENSVCFNGYDLLIELDILQLSKGSVHFNHFWTSVFTQNFKVHELSKLKKSWRLLSILDISKQVFTKGNKWKCCLQIMFQTFLMDNVWLCSFCRTMFWLLATSLRHRLVISAWVLFVNRKGPYNNEIHR